LLLLAIALAIAAQRVSADEAADHIERANLLRKFLEDITPVRVGEPNPRAELPAARLEREQHNATERLRVEQFQDGQWRRLLESQRSSAHRQEVAPTSPRSALTFEREQRARDLSIQIQRQDFEYRQNNRR